MYDGGMNEDVKTYEPVKTDSQVKLGLDLLQKEIEQLQEILKNLVGKLDFVMLPEIPKPETSGDVKSVSCSPLSDNLAKKVYELQRLSAMLRDVLSRIEV